MPEVAYSREYHRDTQPIRRCDHFRIFDGTTGLDDGGCAISDGFFQAIREGKEGI